MGDLGALGFDSFFADQIDPAVHGSAAPARIATEGRGQYTVVGCRVPDALLSGRLQYDLAPEQHPVTGDWVLVDDSLDRAVIHHVLKRRTELSRRAAGSRGERQVLVANVDVFFVVTTATRDFNARRLERYLAVVRASGAQPVIVLNKADLDAKTDNAVAETLAIAPDVPVLRTSATRGDGLDALREHLAPGRTVGLIGSSGVGKSTLVNCLLGNEVIATGATRRDEKGRHTTTRRELHVLPGGGVLIDTPGMRELGMLDHDAGVNETFPDILSLASQCRFGDCRHESEPGCGVLEAVETGRLDGSRLESYRHLQREIASIERRRDPIEGSRSKRRWKTIHKEMRERYKRDPKGKGRS